MSQHSVADTFAEQATGARYRLVQTLKQLGVLQHPAIEAAFLSIPRHLFLNTFYQRQGNAPPRWKQITPSAPHWAELVYENEPRITLVNDSGHPISSSSAPDIMAKELEIAAIEPGMHVLEIGTGTGYNAALISHLVGDPKLVTSVELDETLAQLAQQCLNRVIGPGVHVISGDGYQGYAPHAPYDRIVATASTQQVPLTWIDQLRDGGILVLHLQGYLGSGVLVRFQKTGPGRKGEGQIVMGSDFMELRKSTSPSLITHRLLPQFLRGSVTAEIPFTDEVFDPAVLWDVNVAFLLQIVLPTMRVASISKTVEEIPQMCLLDTHTHTLLTFRPLETRQWSVEVRGDSHLWERVLSVYHQWLTLQRPSTTAYRLVIDAQGKQMITLPPSSGLVSSHEWVLEEGPRH
jgi:protein-L-isoaspartate(D-aspartate) O-methyltransferase